MWRLGALTIMVVTWACVLPGPPPLGGACDLDAGRTCPRGVCVEGRCVDEVPQTDAGCAKDLCVISVHHFAQVMTDVVAVGPSEAWLVGDDVLHAIDGGLTALRPRLSAAPLTEIEASGATLFAGGETTAFFRFERGQWAAMDFLPQPGVVSLVTHLGQPLVATSNAIYRWDQAWSRVGLQAGIASIAVLPDGTVLSSNAQLGMNGPKLVLWPSDGGPATTEDAQTTQAFEQMIVAPDGSLWALVRNRALKRRSPAGAWTEIMPASSQASGAGGLWASSTGDVFVCGASSSFARVRPDGGQTEYTSVIETGLSPTNLRWNSISGTGREVWLVGRVYDGARLADAGVAVHLRFND